MIYNIIKWNGLSKALLLRYSESEAQTEQGTVFYGASRHMLCILSLQRDLVLEEICQGELEWGVMGLFILTSITSEHPLKYIFIKNHNKSIYD